jgi:type VI protein secretion system component VasF
MKTIADPPKSSLDGYHRAMGFNRRKMKDARRQLAEKEAAARRATEAQVLEDAERLVAAWNERQAKRMPMLFSPTIGAAITARFWFLWVRCPACLQRTRLTCARSIGIRALP